MADQARCSKPRSQHRRFKLTKTEVDKRGPEPGMTQTIYWDTDLPGFGICIGSSSKTYMVQRTIGSRVYGTRRIVKVKIGRHGVFTADEARRRARELLVQFADGEDPRHNQRVDAARQLTLEQAWTQFKQTRSLKPQTEQHYKRAIEYFLRDWLRRPLGSITGTDVIEMYTKMVHDPDQGRCLATRTMRVFRAVYNFAEGASEGLPKNPTTRLTRLKLWRRDGRRTSYIPRDQLPAWYAAVMRLTNDSARDYLRLILFTGMRRSEAMGLRWDSVDFARRAVTIPLTKNGDPLVLPLSRAVINLLHDRRRRYPDAVYVFPGETKTGHLQEPKKWVAQVAATSGIAVTLHDLRRTFATIGESVNVGQTTIQRLLNHRPGRDTASNNYIVLGIEPLREHVERIAAYIQRAVLVNSKSVAARDHSASTTATV
jgi:integrase